jgi:hypothetical protein
MLRWSSRSSMAAGIIGSSKIYSRVGTGAAVRTVHLAAPAADEDQASAGARSAPTALLHPWKAAVPLPLSRSMQLDTAATAASTRTSDLLRRRSTSWVGVRGWFATGSPTRHDCHHASRSAPPARFRSRAVAVGAPSRHARCSSIPSVSRALAGTPPSTREEESAKRSVDGQDFYGQPAPGIGVSTVSTWPVRGP